jgi:YfiH family protein
VRRDFRSACYIGRLDRYGLQLVSRDQLSLMESGVLARLPWLVHGFSLRYARCGPPDGSRARRGREFNLGFTPHAERREVERNRARFLGALDARALPASLHQIHSAVVWEVRRGRDPARHDPGADRSVLSPLDYRPAGWQLPEPGDPETTRASAGCDLSVPAPAGSLEGRYAGDALVTSEPGVILSIRTADCLPVLLADRRRRVIAAIHAGWRGALARVIEKTVGELRRLSGSRPEDLVAVLGPAIGRCCYEVGEEVIDAFSGQFVTSDAFFHKPAPKSAQTSSLGVEAQRSDLRYILLFHTQAPPGHRRERRSLHLDLTAVARAQLRAAGLKPSAVHASEFCTVCRPDLFLSHRRDGGRAGRMMAAIGLRSQPQQPVGNLKFEIPNG